MRSKPRSRQRAGLTDKQRRFVDEYMVDRNATQAAIRAGFSAKTAYSAGSRLLRNVEVAADLGQRCSAVARRTEVTVERIVQEYAAIAFDERPFKTAPTLRDRIDALNSLGKYLAMFVDRHELDVGAHLKDALSQIKAQMSPDAQKELVRAVGSVIALARGEQDFNLDS